MTWRTELASALRRLETALPQWEPLPSIVFYASRATQIARKRVGPYVKLGGSCAQLKVKDLTRPYRLITCTGRDVSPFTRHAFDLVDGLYQVQHPRIGTEWMEHEQIGGDPLTGCMIQWLLAVHSFARESDDAEIVALRDGQPRQWDATTAVATLIADTAKVSAKLADWIVNTESIGLCPVELRGEEQPPLVLGQVQAKALSLDQYSVVSELVRVFPGGITERGFGERKATTHIQSPRHVLMGLMGMRPRPGKKTKPTIWADVIVNPGKAGVGWRLKPR